MTPRSEMGAPSPATLRMRRSRERRRQGDVIVKLEIGPNMTTDLVALGWLPAPDRGDHDALARALLGLIDRAIAMRATPSTIESESVCLTPLRATAGSIAIGSDEDARQSPRFATLGERDGPQGPRLGSVEPGEVRGAAEIADDKLAEHAELSRPEPPGAQPWAEPTQPFEVDAAQFWGPRLFLWLGRRMWMAEWGPRPDQDGCLVPNYLL